MRKWPVILAVSALVAGGATPASALLFNLTSDHCTGGCGPAGTIFGTVNLVQNGTTVDVTVHLNSPFAFANTGSADNTEFKFNGAPSLASITVDARTPFSVAQQGALNGDGTGTFNFGITCNAPPAPAPGCGGGLSTPNTADIVFHVAGATIAQLTVPNGNGNVFVADVGNTLTGNTGPIDATTPVPGPVLGAGLPGLVMACGGLLALARRRRQKIV